MKKPNRRAVLKAATAAAAGLAMPAVARAQATTLKVVWMGWPDNQVLPLMAEFEKRLSALDPGQEIVAYCRGPYCVLSYEAVAHLRARGFRIRRLEDGYPEWRAAGLPVEAGLPS